jgi:hypothetical protein
LHSSGTGEILEYNETVHQLYIYFKKASDSVRKGVLYNILIEFGVPIKPFKLIELCFNEIYSEVCKHLSDAFPIQNGLKQGDATLPLPGGTGIEWDTLAFGVC